MNHVNSRNRRGRDRIIVGFTATYVISANRIPIKFVSGLRQIGGFLWEIRFTPTKKNATINWNIVESSIKHNNPNTQYLVFYA